MYIKVNLDPLESAASFPCLCRIITYNNINWVALYHNLGKAQRQCAMVSKVL